MQPSSRRANRLWSQIDASSTIKAAWPFVRPDRRSLVKAGLATLLLTVVEISIPLLSRELVDLITGSSRHIPDLVPWRSTNVVLVLLFGLAFARGGLLGWQRALAGRIGERTAGRLRSTLWTHLQGMPVEETQRRGSGRLLVRFVSDIRSVQRLVTDVLLQGPQDLFVTTVVLAIMAYLNWWMALPAILLIPAYAAIFSFGNPELRRLSRAARRRRTRLSAFVHERIVGLKIVKAQVQEQAEATRVKRMTRALAKRGSRLASTAARIEGAAATAVTCSLALTLALASREIVAGRVTGGTLVAFIMLHGLLTPMLRRIARLNRSAQEAAVSISRLQTTLDQPAEANATRTTRRLRVRRGEVKVKQVSLVGQDGAALLDAVSLEAHRGELVALAGATGSGKSILLDLLLRFKEPTSGRIVIDGRRIDNVSLASLRAQVGWVPQDAPLFDSTLQENVAYGALPSPTRETIVRAVEQAGLGRLVARLPKGIETRVGTGGLTLSPGERQRVALARALLSDPPILVLDELLPGEADEALARMLRDLAREKTVLVMTRQLPILLKADRVYVLEGGRVVEQGRHDDLLGRSDLYRRLVSAEPLLTPVSCLLSPRSGRTAQP